MDPYRRAATRRPTPVVDRGSIIRSADGVLPWMLMALGGGRVAQALWMGEIWGAEATLCLGVLMLGVFELVRSLRPKPHDAGP